LMSAAELLAVDRPERTRLSLRFLGSELKIIFGRRRNLAGMGVLAVVPIILAIAIRVESGTQGPGTDFIIGITGNGLFIAFAALILELPLFLPLAVSAISGDAVAGEANLGTLRYLLTIPAGRLRLLVVKYVAVVIFAFVATALVATVGTIMGLALFGAGDMTLLSGTQTTLADGLWRLLLSVLYLTVQLSALGAIGLFISTLTEQPIGATIAVLLVNVGMFILGQISQLAWLHPWLLTNWWPAIGDFVRDPIFFDNLQRGLITAAVYGGTFWLLAWARFSTKDITS
ncbi:MAG TPA: ABC transporter permease, partial [Propionibacteriaceae bacterium]|nr:ABC transporter permease [Propionibacteriaceae bacterium]